MSWWHVALLLATGGQFGGRLGGVGAAMSALSAAGGDGVSMLDFAVSGADNQLEGLIVTSANAASAAAAAAATAADSTIPINGSGGGGGGGGGEEGVGAENSTGFVVVGGSNYVVSESVDGTMRV